MTKVLHEITNAADGMTACVVESSGGGFGVSLRDDDSGLFAPVAIHGIKTIEAAIAKAQEIAG